MLKARNNLLGLALAVLLDLLRRLLPEIAQLGIV